MKLTKNVYGVWIGLVLLNVIMSILVAMPMMKTMTDFIGVIMAIAVFIILYAWFDMQLLKRGKEPWRTALYGGVIITALTQFYPIFALLAGAVAIDAWAFISGSDINNEAARNFFSFFSVTVIEGLLLSVIVFIIMFLIRFLMFAKQAVENHDS